MPIIIASVVKTMALSFLGNSGIIERVVILLLETLAKKTDWQEIEQLPGQTIREKFQKKLGVEVDPALTFKKLEESLKYKV